MRDPQLGFSCVARGGAVCAMIAALLLSSGIAPAATINISFTGLDLVYDGVAIYDAGNNNTTSLANPADGDELATIDFFVNGNLVGSLNADLAADVYIPDVSGITTAFVFNPVTTPGNPGFFDLLIGSTWPPNDFLLISLDEVNVVYVNAGMLQVTFGAAISNIFAQNLPFVPLLDEPVTVSFNVNIVPGTLTASGGFVTGFEASGSGSVQGPAVPEPSTCLLASLGLMTLFTRRGRA